MVEGGPSPLGRFCTSMERALMTRVTTRRPRAVAAVLLAASVAVSVAACTSNSDDASTRTPVVAPSVAMNTVTAVMQKAVAARLDTTPGGQAAREAAYSGPALESANAFAKALPVMSAAEKGAAELSSDAKLLAVSESGTLPQQLLVQATKKKTGDAVLVLLQADQAGGPFTVVAETPMLPDAKLDALDPTASGSAAIGNGSGLAASPKDVAAAFAASVAFPNPRTSPLLGSDPLSDQLRTSATAQGKALGSGGVFTQTHAPGEILGGMRLKDGKGAIVFAHFIRDDRIAMSTPLKLTPAKDVRAITGIKLITTEADLKTNEIVAFVIPQSGPARAIAAWEQLVSGTGR